MHLATLSVDDVLQIYAILVRDFEHTDDPIAPVGVRDNNLLESAVSRQHTGFGEKRKYVTSVLNAASLCYGICCDHVFLNGNKRAALVAMLVHLDRNELCLPGTSQDQLYDLMVSVADHKLGNRRAAPSGKRRDDRPDSDSEVEELAKWLRKRVEPAKTGEKPITYRQLRRILSNYGVHMENEGQNRMELVRYADIRTGLLRRRTESRRVKLGTVGYRDEGTIVARGDIKQARKLCELDEQHGVDSDMFYSTGEVIDAFVNKYRKVLRKLAKV